MRLSGRNSTSKKLAETAYSCPTKRGMVNAIGDDITSRGNGKRRGEDLLISRGK